MFVDACQNTRIITLVKCAQTLSESSSFKGNMLKEPTNTEIGRAWMIVITVHTDECYCFPEQSCDYIFGGVPKCTPLWIK